nr:MAG TPA: antirepressor protein [Ackermannviridae sp.]
MKISLNNLVKLGEYEVKSLNVEGISYIGTMDIASLHKYKVKDVEELINLCKDKFESKELIEIDKDNNLELKDKYLLSDSGYLKFLEILEDTRTKERYNYMCMNFFNKKVVEEPKQEIRVKDTITSLELLEQINIFRKQEYEDKRVRGTLTEAEQRKGTYTELLHKSLLEVIRDEFEYEIGEQKILPSSYKNSQNKEQPMFILNIDYAKQILMRESKYVRRAVVLYLNKLEDRVKELEKQITTKDQYMLNIMNSKSDVERAINISKFNVEYVVPLEDNLKEETDKRILKDLELKSQKHKVDLYDTIADKDKTFTMSEVAKLINYIGVGRNKLFEILRFNEILRANNEPYQTYVDRGWFKIIVTEKGTQVVFQTVVYQKGVEKICELLDGLGYKKAIR